MLRKPLLMLCVLLPPGLKKLVYRGLFGWKIGKNVKIGLSYIDSTRVMIGDHSRIGHFNVMRGLRDLKIGSHTYIANFNEIFGASHNEDRFASVLCIGDHVNFMSHHFVDVAGTVNIGNHTTVGGRDTHFWSHSVYLKNDARVMEPTEVCIGDDVYVGARATLVSCSVPNGAFVGAGSVVTKKFDAEECRFLIAGNPGTIKKRYMPAEEVPSGDAEGTGPTYHGVD